MSMCSSGLPLTFSVRDMFCSPSFVQVFFRKGNVLQEMGRTKEALIQFRDCLRLQAEFAPATSQIKKVGVA